MPYKDKLIHKEEDISAEVISSLKSSLPTLTKITLSGSSYGLEACKLIGGIIKDAPNLKRLNFSNCFIGKLKEEIPVNLKALLEGVAGKNLEEVDFSDNAFGPSGVPGFDFFLKSTPSITVLRMINCGLGPMGGKALADCLKDGNLKLVEFYAGRNRLEDDGYEAIAKVLGDMGTLVKIEMPQNFVKKQGMISMLTALKLNKSLSYVHIHDNWLKEEAINEFCSFIKSQSSLKSVNISDCDIGGLGVKKIVRALGNSPSRDTITEFLCNYNDVERTQTIQYIFNVFRVCKNLSHVSFIGNIIKAKLKKALVDEYKTAGKSLALKDESEDNISDDELEEEELSEEEEEGEDSDRETDETKKLEEMFENLNLE